MPYHVSVGLVAPDICFAQLGDIALIYGMANVTACLPSTRGFADVKGF